MAKTKSLSMKAPWKELKTTDADWANADPVLLGRMLTQMHLIRAFEEKVLELDQQGLVHGPAHSSIGQEGGAVGSVIGLRVSDEINGSHRGHHQFLAKALNYVAPDGLDPKRGLTGDTQDLLTRTLAEIMGLSQGFCKGRGGSMHLRWADAGCLGTNAIVGGGVPLAAGAAWCHRKSGTGDVAITYFGDGAVNIGSALETMNLAAAWKLPMCFFIENNLYAVATSVGEATGEDRLSSRGPAFNIPSWRVDGMDPLAVHLAMQEAADYMRAGHGPTLIEAEVYRYFHQSGPLPGSAFGYRTKEEEAKWRERDPLDALAKKMEKRKLLNRKDVAALRQRALEAMDKAVEELTEAQGNELQIKPDLWPSPGFRDFGLRGDLSELDDARTEEQETFSGALADTRFVDVIAKVMDRRMGEDDRIVVLGEDIHRLRGGTNGATKGLSEKYPDRVLGTPISENAFAGLGGGMAMDGRYRPVVEFMYADFMWVAADQVFNQIGKARHMFGGDRAMPLVLRSKCAMGTGYGSQHSMDPAGIYATSPGWRIIAPSTPFDYVGLMNSALRCEDPVLVIEHVDLYTAKAPAPVDDFDYHIPFGKARIARQGSAMTIVTYLGMVQHCVDACEALGVDAEIIDLRSLDRAGIDWETITASVQKTNNVLVVEQGALGTSYGTILGDEIQRRLFDYLDQPVARVLGGEASPSVSKVLERAAMAQREEVETGVRAALDNVGMALAE